MLKVKDIMTKDVITISPEVNIATAVEILLSHHINGIPVVDDNGKLLGIICQSDLVIQQKKMPIPSLFALLDGFIPFTSLKHLEKEVQKIAATTVEQAMTKKTVTVGPDAGIDEVAELMVVKGFHTLPVLDNEILIGIIGKEDVLKTLFTVGTDSK